MRHLTFSTLALYSIIFSIPSIWTHLPNDDIDIIRQRVLQWIWPASQDIPSVTDNALQLLSRLNSSCYWPDINYYDKNRVLWNTANHIHRITTMLQALSVNGSLVRNNTSLRAAIHCALNVWLINDWQNPNWWFNEIDTPMYVSSQLLMLDGNVTDFELQKMKEISYRAAWWLHRATDTGANLLDMIRSQLYRSLATNNITGIEQGFSRIWEDIAKVHTARITKEKFDELEEVEILPHPSYSPDAAPSDFGLFRSMKHFFRGRRFESFDQIEETC